VEAAAEGDVVSRREAPRRVQVDHPPSRIISDINERTTRSRSRNASHFAHSAFVATFEPKDIGHVLSDPNLVNSMHEELENFERNQVWELVEPPLLTVNSCIKVRLDLQVDKSLVVVKGPFFPRVVNPRYRIRGTNV
jgi:hypothetical protein